MAMERHIFILDSSPRASRDVARNGKVNCSPAVRSRQRPAYMHGPDSWPLRAVLLPYEPSRCQSCRRGSGLRSACDGDEHERACERKILEEHVTLGDVRKIVMKDNGRRHAKDGRGPAGILHFPAQQQCKPPTELQGDHRRQQEARNTRPRHTAHKNVRVEHLYCSCEQEQKRQQSSSQDCYSGFYGHGSSHPCQFSVCAESKVFRGNRSACCLSMPWVCDRISVELYRRMTGRLVDRARTGALKSIEGSS